MAVVVALFAAGSTFAGEKKSEKSDRETKGTSIVAIKGKVVDDEGKPADAEIHVKALDRKVKDVVVMTDSRGKYIVTDLDMGRYAVTAFDDHGFARSRAVVQVPRKGWANVNFDLALDQGAGDGANRVNGHIHDMVTSHMGVYKQ